MLGYYNFDKYKTDAHKKLNKIYLYHPKRIFKKVIEDALYIANVQNEIRSLINMPANLLNSIVYTKYIKDNISKKIKIKIYDENKLKKIGCNLILGVTTSNKVEESFKQLGDYKYAIFSYNLILFTTSFIIG